MRSVSTDRAPAPAGHYSQAVVHGGVIYVAGQLAKDPDDPDAPPGDAAAQTRTVVRNVATILEAAGSALDRILQTTIYVSDISLWGEVNAAYAEAMGEHRPARAIIPVAELPRGCVLEMQVIAAAASADG